MSAAPTVLVERRGAIAVMTLNRPDRRNGVTAGMCAAIHDAAKPPPSPLRRQGPR